jgi:hypothetical protein
MSDLEQQRRALRQEWPERSVSGGGQIPALTVEQRALAHTFYGHLIACGIERLTKSGVKFMSRGNMSASTGMMDALRHGAQLGLWKEVDGKSYYTHNHLTRPFMLAALALHDERVKLEQKRTADGQGNG